MQHVPSAYNRRELSGNTIERFEMSTSASNRALWQTHAAANRNCLHRSNEIVRCNVITGCGRTQTWQSGLNAGANLTVFEECQKTYAVSLFR